MSVSSGYTGAAPEESGRLQGSACRKSQRKVNALLHRTEKHKKQFPVILKDCHIDKNSVAVFVVYMMKI